MSTPAHGGPGATTSPWFSTDELDAIRLDLISDVERLRRELHLVGDTMSFAPAPASGDVLHDQLDVAAQHSDILEDTVRAENAMAILVQTESVLARLDSGLYGVCESCHHDVGRPRLEAFPRATQCITCVR